ncbi:MAG: ribonuclease III [Alphaproteobacteria bacterium]|nr:ribonuclease III [Alphaproteobacteria bacterium]
MPLVSRTKARDGAPAAAVRSRAKDGKTGTLAFGHRFKDETLLARALTHASAVGDDNEQLEFLGDRVLGFLIAELLMNEFPKEKEGSLALKLNAMVRMEACARVAEAAGIDKALIMAASEDRSGGRKKAAILGDACEAVIAALYLDGGIDAARKFVTHHWQPFLAEVTGDLRDPKNALQEWAQGRKLGTPAYRVAKREGPDHAPHFTVEVSVRGRDPASGQGASLRAAEQAAARALMKELTS